MPCGKSGSLSGLLEDSCDPTFHAVSHVLSLSQEAGNSVGGG